MTGKNTVLIVDDEQVNRLNLRKILESSYEIMEACDGKEALEILEKEEGNLSAIILDLVMPGFSGYEFMEVYQKTEKFRSIPVVVATVDNDVKTEMECLERGAWDFVSKPYDPGIIRFRVKNVIDRSQMQLSRELRYRAEYDTLTDIYNKTKFFSTMQEMLRKYPDRQFILIRMDIQKFQLVNSFYGVEEGDKLLKYIADYLKKDAASHEKIVYGYIRADIFAIFMEYEKKEEIIKYMDNIHEMLNAYPLEFDIIPAFGIYRIDDKSLSVSEMYERANLATKKCKGSYIKNYACYTEEMTKELVREQMIVNNMKNALASEQFVLYLQPKYELKTNTMAGAEVLVRWMNPDKGLVSPGEFIPIFERNGFIMQLDFYVWDKTCQLLHKWMMEGKNVMPVSVNISRVSMYHPKLVEVICDLVKKYDIPPELLQLELTESAYTSNPATIKNMMESLQQKGFCILMDDFGSGYSSLNVLKDIAVDVLKIDMKFLSSSNAQGRSENILAAVVRMAKWLNMPVVAEGVEKKEQISFLRSIGCEYVQGYYFARPMPVEDFENLAFSGENHFIEQQTVTNENGDNLWNSTSQMEILFANMLQAVAVYEYQESVIDIIRVNNAYYELFGYNDINQSQYNLKNSMNEENWNQLLRAFEEVVRTEDVTECEIERWSETGRKIWISVKLKYVSRVGEKHVIFGCVNDITSQKEIEHALQNYRQAMNATGNGTETVLVVDDMEINRVSLRSILENEYRVLEAENGKQALEMLEQSEQKVDIILLDLTMPVMGGTEFLKYKNEKIGLYRIPVIVITADDTAEQQVEAMHLGAKDYVVKPFIPEIVTRRVRNVLDSTKNVETEFQKNH